jgi:alkanesulfonate monooxygenase SsuD/methylene tetrahydromethanopterin reductase-like flavin-dependent oxidoreductase (luciferase family)
MFRAWTFTEMPYPYLPPADTYESLRVTLPNRMYDPELGHQLYSKYFDIYQAADDLGLDMMLNEHHSTATCVEPAVPVTMAVLARITQHGRILALGNPIANRNTPIRVAEEMAMIDVISHGRAEVGFVRGVPYEVSAGNVNPVEMKERFWESAELIVRSWTNPDGPFNWEGRYYHHRQVNVWPRPYQDPHPPLWVPTQSSGTVAETAERRYKLGLILCGADGARRLFDIYRTRTGELGYGPTPLERLGYLGLVFVGDTDEEGFAGARKLQWYIQHNKVATQFMDVPGYIDVATRARMMRAATQGKPISTPIEHLAYAPIEELVRDGYFFAGNPDTVFEQLKSFYGRVGGFGNFMMMVQGGTMGYDLVERSMRRFAEEVLPRFRSEVYGRDVDPALAAAS